MNIDLNSIVAMLIHFVNLISSMLDDILMKYAPSTGGDTDEEII